ncbi:MAG: ABC transporter permease [archaeon YNP-LCB-003-016]|uniref:ABC transporter permease n=1 Tax=Candidatus Culexarchaeum yellowstonense TaxID=2928963 RepID=UPI0026EBCB14|nr:ABC transporter permease [Candidatus Culexarchaeum yellowstonense]MCR6691310.1 ABC transporter permease [Candidatus Culexarchaeum yellowstonense]
MKLKGLLKLALKQLMERRTRTILTILAIAVGVTSIIALSAQVEGVSNEIFKTLEKLGPNTIIVTVRSGGLFTDVDVSNVKGLSGVAKVAPIFITTARVTGINDRITILGASTTDMQTILGSINLIKGEAYYDVPSPQAVIGYNIAVDDTGAYRYDVGQSILVQIGSRNIMMITVGILDSYGTSTIINPDTTIFIPIDYLRLLLRTSGYTAIIVKTNSIDDVDSVMELIRYMFGGRASITSIKQITSTVQAVTSQISLLLVGIAGTSFVAAGLGTFNIMTISVLERVREIGILKAIGMKDRGVLALYLSQGLILGILGSGIGIILGVAIAYIIPILLGSGARINVSGQNILSTYTPKVTPTYIFMSVMIAVLVAVVSSAYPSWKAAKMNPVEALRYE